LVLGPPLLSARPARPDDSDGNRKQGGHRETWICQSPKKKRSEKKECRMQVRKSIHGFVCARNDYKEKAASTGERPCLRFRPSRHYPG
jgi:hypothetical protein